jgi:hypothetical protein
LLCGALRHPSSRSMAVPIRKHCAATQWSLSHVMGRFENDFRSQQVGHLPSGMRTFRYAARRVADLWIHSKARRAVDAISAVFIIGCLISPFCSGEFKCGALKPACAQRNSPLVASSAFVLVPDSSNPRKRAGASRTTEH